MIVDGIDVVVTKKKIKYIHLYVKAPDGRVEVTAPMRQSDESIKRFIHSRLDWIIRNRGKYGNTPLESTDFVNGDTVFVWGRKYALVVVDEGSYGVRIDNDNLVLSAKVTDSASRREEILNLWYKKILGEAIARLLPKWEERTGLYSSGWRIKNMTSRWGSCNVESHKICFNLRLAKKLPVCLEYVILHELAHRRERGHKAPFKAILDEYMPDWRDIRKILNGQRVVPSES